MISMAIIILVLGIISVLYAIPYANWEFKQKNKAGAIMIYIIALATLTTSIIQLFN